MSGWPPRDTGVMTMDAAHAPDAVHALRGLGFAVPEGGLSAAALHERFGVELLPEQRFPVR
ncbi:hypothetical protein GCM10010339_40120 [Streptomyces alanosinicus]|uniref:Uncharacterized protein n=1 Tax=Streptomyces alanosinicus TaxID=68171 RepID=A0A918YIJ9_9ACTN|nr:hypothetical protein GCM10010339_40120 [Streptomyces alanosinicus]